ncbi:hypothetical protein VCR17J2_350214 [Vibrio coralliirubri]|nr:hypothetical protein VCR29J2_360308 [Vibrio coralliirubri]CDU12050.1 hypothetical protein VCR17J2_350214 [Vibrio coralliirubri]
MVDSSPTFPCQLCKFIQIHQLRVGVHYLPLFVSPSHRKSPQSDLHVPIHIEAAMYIKRQIIYYGSQRYHPTTLVMRAFKKYRLHQMCNLSH